MAGGGTYQYTVIQKKSSENSSSSESSSNSKSTASNNGSGKTSSNSLASSNSNVATNANSKSEENKAAKAEADALKTKEVAAIEAKKAAEQKAKAEADMLKAKEAAALQQKEAEEKRLREEAAALKAEAKAAEDTMNDCIDDCNAEKKKLADVKAKLKKKLGADEKTELKKQRDELKESVKDKEEIRDDAADKTTIAYNILGAFFKEHGLVGDPVKVVSGDFFAEYTDFEATDYLEKFQVKRNLLGSTLADSFGAGWSCSLDSRIIRCSFESQAEVYDYVNEGFAATDGMKSAFDSYTSQYSKKYPRSEIESYRNEALDAESQLKGVKEYLDEREAVRKNLSEKNKYVTYGRYADLSSYTGTEDFLIYLDEEGLEHHFYYEGNNIWRALGTLFAAEVYIQELTENDGGGYQLVFADGHRKKYSAYGILDYECDLNGNKVQYSAVNGKINQVKLKTGELITITRRADGKITQIKGPVSGQTNYYYSGNYLTGVLNNDGVYLAFGNDQNGKLSKITKADNSFICLTYEYDSSLWKYVCTAVTDEKGQKETFR